MLLVEKGLLCWQRGGCYGISIYSDCYRDSRLCTHREFGVCSFWRDWFSVNPLWTIGNLFFDLHGMAADFKVEGS